MESDSDQSLNFMKHFEDISKEKDSDESNDEDDEWDRLLIDGDDEEINTEIHLKQTPKTSKEPKNINLNYKSFISLSDPKFFKRKKKTKKRDLNEDSNDDIPKARDEEEIAFLANVANSYDDDNQQFIDSSDNISNLIKTSEAELIKERNRISSYINFKKLRDENQRIEISLEEEFYMEFKKRFLFELDDEIATDFDFQLLPNKPKLKKIFSEKFKTINLDLSKSLDPKIAKVLLKDSISRFKEEISKFIRKNNTFRDLFHEVIFKNLPAEELFIKESEQRWKRFLNEEEEEEEDKDAEEIENRLLLSPYFKTPDGRLSVPKISSFDLPYVIKHINWTLKELSFLRKGVIIALAYEKTKPIEDFLLQKFQELDIQDKNYRANQTINTGQRKLVLFQDKDPQGLTGNVVVSVFLDSLIKWKENEVKRIIKETQRVINTNPKIYKECPIPWDIVATFMAKNKIFDLSERECWRTFWFSDLNFWTNSSEWNPSEINSRKTQIRRMQLDHGKMDWDQYAALFGEGRLSFNIFSMYRILGLEEKKNLPFFREELRYLNFLIRKYGIIQVEKILYLLYEQRRRTKMDADEKRIEMMMLKRDKILNMGPLSPHRFITKIDDVKKLFSHKFNPMFKSGPIDLTENVLFLVIVEKISFLIIERCKLFVIDKFLPWRSSNTWKSRCEALLSHEWTNKWSLEDDRKLLELYQEHGNNYLKISDIFGKFASRKAIRGRVYKLKEALKTQTLEEFHQQRERYGFQTSRSNLLKRVFIYLVKFLNEFKDEPPLKFFGFHPHRPPTDVELFHYLLSQSRALVLKTAVHIRDYIVERGKFWKSNPLEVEEPVRMDYLPRTMSLDRKKYDEKNPASVASALLIREIALKSDFKDIHLTVFEREIIQHYRNFEFKTKDFIAEDTIPKAHYFYLLPLVSNIIVIPNPPSKRTKNAEPLEIYEGVQRIKKIKSDKSAKGFGKKGPRIKRLRQEIAAMRWKKQKMEEHPCLVTVDASKSDTKR